MDRTLRPLIIEDSEEDAQLLLRELRHGGYEVEFARVETAEAMQSALAQKAWDLVLSDYSLPQFSALKALEVLKASGLDLPFIIISGTIGEDMAVTALKAGANDFLIKGNFARLGPAIERELREAESRRGRKQAIESLRQSEERYRTLFESNPHPMWVYDLETLRFLAVNDAAVLHYGYSQEEFRSMTIKGIQPAEDVPALMANLTEIRQDLHTPTIWRHRKKDGTVIDVEIISHSLQWKNRPARLVLANDITERKRAEEQVRAQATRLKLLADVSQAFASVVQDYDGMLDVVARQIAEMLGGFCGVRLLSDDGKWLEMGAMYDVDPAALELARMLSDQTPLRADEPNFSQRILQSSQALLWPGISEDQLRTMIQPEHWANLKYVASQSRILAPTRVRGHAIGFLIISRKPGSPAFDEHDLRLAQDLADRAALTISNARLFQQVQNELTERTRAEEALRTKNEEIKIMSQQLWQAAKLATMGELAASIAHELNNPLATISLRTEMLLAQFSPDAPQSRSLQIVDSEVKRMSSLVANLLEFSRRNSSQISTVDVRKELVNTLELVQYHLRKYNILTVQEFSPETPLAQVDRQQLRQVFLNLFTNAADAMPQGGTLTIRTGPSEKPALGLTAPLRLPVTASLGLPVSKLPQLLIEVSDTGEGIPPERLERVWEPFYTTKPEGKGTGLGLAICRRIIQEHGGTIEIISEGIPGKGTTIRITLPAVKGI
jgi:PAS domain S-box-containing protein